MLMPEVHTCAQMVVENEKLKKVIRRIRKENDQLKKELNSMKEEQKISTILKQYVTSRESGTQTDPNKPSSRVAPSTASEKKPVETEKLNKMMIMHNNLMKRYEKELKVNMEYLETITKLNLKVNELQQKIISAERQKEISEQQLHGGKTQGSDGLKHELKQVKTERDKLRKENQKLKTELKGLDYGFFEEVEDIKFALQQSAILNKEYERCLHKMCKQFGVPFPHSVKDLVVR